MDKETIANDLAKIYASVMFRDYVSALSADEKRDTALLTRRLYCLYEEAHTAFLMMDDSAFDFSDIKPFTADDGTEIL
ncbi:MAG: hypothetical protein IJ766_09100 [Clostridia bacterium]|nr:hypothetical protein [Clostridia bacterium]